MSDPVHTSARCLVGGRWEAGVGTVGSVVSPWSGEVLGTVAAATPDQVSRAVAAAAAALPGWRDTAPHERAAVASKLADRLESDGGALASTVTAEMGMPTTLAAATQIDLPARVLRETVRAAEGLVWDDAGDPITLLRRPAGVLAAITPWNFPVHQIVAKLAAALLAGCTTVLKPSELTPFDADLLAELALDAGVPPGVLNLVQGPGPEVGEAVVADRRVDRVSFTGSVRGGRAVAALAAGHNAATTLELGGKSPAVLLDDVDCDRAVPGAVATGLVNSGQACNATTRLVVPRGRRDEIEEAVARAVDQLRVGDPSDPATTHGPLAGRDRRDAVRAVRERALADGARVVARHPVQEGERPVVAPTVLADLPAEHPAVRDEIFGPVLVVQTYDDGATDADGQAAAVANDSVYGLSAEVWSADPERAARLARRLDAGQIKINGARTRDRVAAPFGGRRTPVTAASWAPQASRSSRR